MRSRLTQQFTVLNDLKSILHLTLTLVANIEAQDTHGDTQLLFSTLKGLCNDLQCLRALLPEDVFNRFSSKVKWTMNHNTVRDLMEKIESRKTNLQIALQVVSLYIPNYLPTTHLRC